MGPAKSRKAAERETRVQQAIVAVNAGQYSSINRAAKDFNIAESTLRGRITGGKSQQEVDAQRQHLTESEEKALVKWIQWISITGYPPRYSTVKEIAEEIRKRRINSVNDASIQLVEYTELGQQWVCHFLNRHPHLKSTFTHCIDAVRLRETSEEVIMHWLTTIDQFLLEHNIHPENIYNMDESGFSISSI